MNIRSLLFFAFMFSAYTGMSSQKVYSIQEALQKNYILLQLEGVPESTPSKALHYGACMSYKVINKTKIDFAVTFEAGRLLDCTDTQFQTMVVTRDHTVDLKPSASSSGRIYAMCSQYKKKAPVHSSRYVLGDMAGPELRGLVNYINRNHIQTSDAQLAVWSITDNVSIAHMKESNNPVLSQLYNQAHYFKTHKEPVTKKIQFKTQFSEEGKVFIYVFDQNNKKVQVLLSNTIADIDVLSYSFWVANTDYGPGKYKAILFYNGKAYQETEFDF